MFFKILKKYLKLRKIRTIYPMNQFIKKIIISYQRYYTKYDKKDTTKKIWNIGASLAKSQKRERNISGKFALSFFHHKMYSLYCINWLTEIKYINFFFNHHINMAGWILHLIFLTVRQASVGDRRGKQD